MKTEDSDQSHVGPIVFSDETARNQLVENSKVVTFRSADRTTGDTWWRESRLGEKKGDVTVEKIGLADPALPCSNMDDHWELSGFESLEEWQDAIESLNGTLDVGYLYHVARR